MFGTNYTRERIRETAAKQFADNDDAEVKRLWDKVYVAFDQWKQEHGNRKPRANLGMLSDLVGQKPIPFKKAAPWQCADLLTPNPIALAFKLIREEYAPFRAVMIEVGACKVLALLIIGFADDASGDDLLTAHNILIEHATTKTINRRWLMIDAIKERQRRKNLSLGPIAAAKKRIEEKNKKLSVLDKAINDLFDSPDKKGWIWTNEEITTFLMQRGDYGYKESTVLARVKKLAAEHNRKRREKTLAQCDTK